jgi:hypothetical protein
MVRSSSILYKQLFKLYLIKTGKRRSLLVIIFCVAQSPWQRTGQTQRYQKSDDLSTSEGVIVYTLQLYRKCLFSNLSSIPKYPLATVLLAQN